MAMDIQSNGQQLVNKDFIENTKKKKLNALTHRHIHMYGCIYIYGGTNTYSDNAFDIEKTNYWREEKTSCGLCLEVRMWFSRAGRERGVFGEGKGGILVP